MALTQMQLIQSLGEAMSWFERELLWGVPPTELRHLCGRIGELYVALITNGQMALRVNQQGYDVVSGQGERISVKTTAKMGATGHIAFNPNTLSEVDRIIVLRVNAEEMQVEILLDASLAEALALMSSETDGRRVLPLNRLIKKSKPRSQIKTIKEVLFDNYKIRELESGSVEIEKDGVAISPAKPELRAIALQLNISLLNTNGNPLNTRQLGSQIIKSVEELKNKNEEKDFCSDDRELNF